MKRTHLICSLLLLTVLMVGVPAGANVLPPGGSGAPDTFSNTLGTFLATAFGSFTITSVDGTATGEWVAQVWRDSVSGNLDFIYGIQSNASSTDIVERLTMTNFGGFITDVGYINDGTCWAGGGFTCSPTDSPTNVTRSLFGGGSVIGFNFGNGILPGTETYVLIIETNAKYYKPGSFSIQDGGTQTVSAFAPTNVPEPASLLMFGSGLVGLGGMLRRKLGL